MEKGVKRKKITVVAVSRNKNPQRHLENDYSGKKDAWILDTDVHYHHYHILATKPKKKSRHNHTAHLLNTNSPQNCRWAVAVYTSKMVTSSFVK